MILSPATKLTDPAAVQESAPAPIVQVIDVSVLLLRTVTVAEDVPPGRLLDVVAVKLLRTPATPIVFWLLVDVVVEAEVPCNL
ncbi:hypothetical protein ACFSL5_07905 [Ottowia pentelensis]|uniref:Uncharacterized protein n=1 Tax=Ottowia pentelensis TaxID=511108 RepID=A0ABV6PNS5_9BURK